MHDRSLQDELDDAVHFILTAAPYHPDELVRWQELARALLDTTAPEGSAQILWHLAERVHTHAGLAAAQSLFESTATLAGRLTPSSAEERELIVQLTIRLIELGLMRYSAVLRHEAYDIWRADPDFPAARRLLHIYGDDLRAGGRVAEAAAVFLEAERGIRGQLEKSPSADRARRFIESQLSCAEALAAAGNPDRAYRSLISAARLLDKLPPADAAELRNTLCITLAIVAISISARRGPAYTNDQGTELALHDGPDSFYPHLMAPELVGLARSPARAFLNEQAHFWLRRAHEFLGQAVEAYRDQSQARAMELVECACLRAEVHFREGEAQAALQALQWADDWSTQQQVPQQFRALCIGPIGVEVLSNEKHFATARELIGQFLPAIPEEFCKIGFGPVYAHLLLLYCQTLVAMAGSAGSLQRADLARVLVGLRASVRVDNAFLDANVAPISDRHRYACLAPALSRLPRILGVLHKAGRLTRGVVAWAYTSVLRRKFRVSAQTAWEWRRASQDDGELRALLQKAHTLRRQLACHDMDGAPDLVRYRAKRDEISDALDDAEMALSWAIPESFPGGKAHWRDVRAVLPTGAVLIDYVILTPPEAPVRYGAFVISDSIQFHDLGESSTVDATIRDLLSCVDRNSNEPADEAGVQAAARAVAERILWPVLEGVPRTTQLLLCPWGKWLNRVPFAMLPLKDGRLLLEEHASMLVPSALWLLSDASPREPGPPFVLGAPDFDLELPRERRNYLRLEQRALPGTQAEVERIGALLGVTPLVHASAVKQRVESVRAPRIMHIATHGFLPVEGRIPHPNATMAVKIMSKIGGIIIQDNLPAESSLGPVTHDNLIDARADWLELAAAPDAQAHLALVLAGFHAWTLGVEVSAEIGNGMLTASEFATLDLQGTELVVFSACATGLGELVATESSVLGFRRTALLAGAKSTVSSLWNVPDAPTATLMQAFYSHLSDGMDRAESMRRAQLSVRSQHPRAKDWAAFVCEGQPRTPYM